MSKLVRLPKDLPEVLLPYLPPTADTSSSSERPFVTLTYAQSLDSRIAARPGQRTSISHLETKTMTHYLRSKHDGILIGSGTVLADDPGLNCRFDEFGPLKGQIRPIVLDPQFKWAYEGSKLESLVNRGEGLSPWIIVRDDQEEISKEKVHYLETHGGKVIKIQSHLESGKLSWDQIFNTLKNLGLRSVMVEGGAFIINELLTQPGLVDSLIVTVGPVFLGNEGVQVSPPQEVRLIDVQWWTGIQDSVVCARLTKWDKLYSNFRNITGTSSKAHTYFDVELLFLFLICQNNILSKPRNISRAMSILFRVDRYNLEYCLTVFFFYLQH